MMLKTIHTIEYTSGLFPVACNHFSSPWEMSQCRRLFRIRHKFEFHHTHTQSSCKHLYMYYHLELKGIYSDKTANCSFYLQSTHHLQDSVTRRIRLMIPQRDGSGLCPLQCMLSTYWIPSPVVLHVLCCPHISGRVVPLQIKVKVKIICLGLVSVRITISVTIMGRSVLLQSNKSPCSCTVTVSNGSKKMA